MPSIQSIIKYLKLQPHPEGGYYAETYRSSDTVSLAELPAGFAAKRVFCTAIYYLLQGGDFSAFHRIKSDEIWHYYGGVGLHIYTLSPGKSNILKLGNQLNEGYAYQQLVPAGTWFAAKTAVNESFTLAGCTVSPGFDFNDFEMAKRNDLIEQYPDYADWIISLTRG